MPLWSINTIVALLSFVIAAAFGKALIPFLHKLKFGQPIKMKFGPEWHAKKQGTPTMGGILFILSTTIAVGVGYGLYRGFCTNVEVSGVEQLDLNRGAQMFSCAIFAIKKSYRRKTTGFPQCRKSSCRLSLQLLGWACNTGWATGIPDWISRSSHLIFRGSTIH